MITSSTLTSTWSSSSPQGFSTQQVKLSTNGGQTFPTVICTVPGTAQSCNWSITPGLATTAARIRVIATENGTGTNAQDDSDADFTILNNFTSPRAARSYQYDKLNRLERIDYEDDSYVTYTYDKDGNRTEKTHIQP